LKKLLRFFTIELKYDERIFGLDLMRSLAILLVVFIHSDIIVRQTFPHFPEFWVIDGVDLFFVLSGFLIGNILIKNFEKSRNSIETLTNFLKRRWFRTLPNYYLILALVLIYNILLNHNFGLFNYKFLIFLQNLNYPHPSFYNIAWSLSIEEWFYLLFSFSIFVLIKIFPKVELKYLLLVLIIIFILFSTLYRFHLTSKLSIYHYSNEIWDISIRKIILTRFDTIMYGDLGALISFYFVRAWKKNKMWAFCVGLVLILTSHFYLNNGFLKYTLYLNGIGIGIFLLLPLLSGMTKAPNWLKFPITYLSIISYSIYLIHFTLVLIPLLRLFPVRNESLAIIVYILYYFFSIFLSIILYKFFEKPMMNLREKF
jgi:peptidoglycan/LPS O-acetylase OafA/YrhL